MVEKMAKRLCSWKNYNLLGGHITLIKSTLSNLPTYYCQDCEANREDVKGIYLGTWGLKAWPILLNVRVCKTVQEGGLGLGHVAIHNDSLMRKWLWRFPQEPISLWHFVILSKYGIHTNGWDSVQNGRYSLSFIGRVSIRSYMRLLGLLCTLISYFCIVTLLTT